MKYSFTEDGIFAIEWNKMVYTSKVISIENYTEDEKYKLLDEVEASLRQSEFSIAEFNLVSKMPRSHIGDLNKYDRKRNELSKVKCKIVKRDCFVFDTYKNASIERNKYNNDL